MIRVYVVEDNLQLLEDCVLCLNNLNLDCHGAADAVAFNALLAQRLPDVAVLDWMLPGEDGLSIARRLRDDERYTHMGVIFLTARSDIYDRLTGLDAADSYLTKPVDYCELAAVIAAVHRRTGKTDAVGENPPWRLWPKKMELNSPNGEIIPLTERECLMLLKLAESPTAAASAKEIVELLGENWLCFEKNRLELLFSRLRKKFKVRNDPNFNPIRSIRNQGYRLIVPLVINEREDF